MGHSPKASDVVAARNARPDEKRIIDEPNLKSHALRGSAWMIAWRWANRFLGLVNTMILVRLLTPADFGVYSMAMLVVGLIEIFAESGQSLALIRLRNPTREHFDTAWTIQVIFGFALALVIFGSAPVAGRQFHSEAVETLLYLLPLRAIANGFTNIGIVLFRINFDYAKEFRFGVLQRLIATTLTISLAFLLRDYWALVIGVIANRFIGLGLSYVMSSYRPRFCLKELREIWSFSTWMLVVYVSEYVATRIDQLVVASTSSKHDTGVYSVAADVATTPIVDLIQPVMRALFPIYSRITDDPRRLEYAVSLVLGSVASICLAVGAGIALIANDFTLVVLGPRWQSGAPLVVWFGIGTIALGMNYCNETILSVTNNARLTAITIWVRISLLVPCLSLAAHIAGVAGIAATQAFIGLSVLPLNLFMVSRAVGIAYTHILRVLYRPVVAAGAMSLAIHALERIVSLAPLPELLLKVGCGAVVYIGSIIFVWALVGRPVGAESFALNTIRNARFKHRLFRRP